MRKILYGILILAFIQGFKGQKCETFLLSEYVEQIDGKPLILATTGYANTPFLKTTIHYGFFILSKNN